MLQLGQRPLSPSDADQQLFVGRQSELDRVHRALALGFNVYLQGEAGVGKTTFMRRLASELGEQAVTPDLDPSGLPEVDFQDIAWDLESGSLTPIEESGGTLSDHSQLVQKLTAESDPFSSPLIYLLDDLGSAAIDELFGRSRDELWELPVRFVVAGSGTLRPPADTFFESVVDIPPMTCAEIVEVVERRADTAETEDAAALRTIAPQMAQALAPATPRLVLAEARALLLSPGYSVEGLTERLGAARDISDTAAQLLSLLTVIGGAYAGDDRLLIPTGLTRSRVVQVLKELELAGLVVGNREGKRVIYESVLDWSVGSK